jgi:hypothetical protein
MSWFVAIAILDASIRSMLTNCLTESDIVRDAGLQ